MSNAFTGRSAFLKREIERLEREREVLRAAIGDSPTPEARAAYDGRLQELREELERELSSTRIVLLGTSHGIQKNGDPLNTELQARLSYLIRRFAATIIVEEWAHDCPPSFASTLASDRVAYKNVSPRPEEQYRTFCNAPINHPAHNGTLGPCEDAPQFYEYGPLDKQENREKKMVTNVQEAMKDHRVGIFVVGLAHVHSISAKLREAGFNVAAYTWTG
jgi:hypothetical protein